MLNIVNDTVHTLNLSDKINILDSLITNENLSIQDRLTAINFIISTVDTNITIFQDYVRDTINATISYINILIALSIQLFLPRTTISPYMRFISTPA